MGLEEDTAPAPCGPRVDGDIARMERYILIDSHHQGTLNSVPALGPAF